MTSTEATSAPAAPLPLEEGERSSMRVRTSRPSGSPATALPELGFKELYDEHFRFVWRSLRRLGVPESDVADAVQDVFLVVHRRLGEFEGRSKVTTWLYGIAYRVAHDRRKLAHVRRRADDDGAIDERIDEEADVAAAAERSQGLALLDRILDEMTIEQRAVFTLFELEALGGEEIAEMLSIPLGTAYSRLRLAREQFKRSLGRLHAQGRFRESAGGER